MKRSAKNLGIGITILSLMAGPSTFAAKNITVKGFGYDSHSRPEVGRGIYEAES